LRPRVGIELIIFKSGQAQRLCDPRNVHSALYKAPQAAGNQFGFEETPAVTRQRVPIDVLDLTIVCGDAR
jgi:hypothetical protein